MATGLVTGQPMTLEEYERLPEDPRVEFLDGHLLVSPSPNLVHQKAANRLLFALQDVLPDDLDVTTAWSWRVGRNEFIPDLVVFPRGEDRVRLTRTPVLIVEVLSSNRGDDLVLKSARYAAAGLPHYWVLDPRDRVLTAYVLTDGLYELAASVEQDTPAQVSFGPGSLRVDVAQLLAD